MSSNAAARKTSKKKNPASTGPPDPNPVIPMESLYSDPEVKEETNPMKASWLDMVNPKVKEETNPMKASWLDMVNQYEKPRHSSSP